MDFEYSVAMSYLDSGLSSKTLAKTSSWQLSRKLSPLPLTVVGICSCEAWTDYFVDPDALQATSVDSYY